VKWVNHVLVGGAPCALVAPALVPVAILGATAPDWIEWAGNIAGRHIKHRGPTHYFAVWLLGFAFFASVIDFHGIGQAFCWGGLSHVLADSLTVAGVPFSPLSDRRFHLFGGRLRTGGAGEFLIAWGIVAACAAGSALFKGYSSDYVPFFPDWAGRYDRGLVTAKEWRDNRFRLF